METIRDEQNKEVIIICELSVNDDRTIDEFKLDSCRLNYENNK